jgi:peroxiredoxin
MALRLYNAGMQTLSIGQSVPSITLPDLQGRVHMLSDYLSRIVALYFWSAGCPHSARVDREMPAWGERVSVLRVASNDNESAGMLESAARRRGLPIVLYDAGHVAADRFGVQVTPHFFVIDALGILRYRGAFDDAGIGFTTPTRGYVADAIQSLLTGQTPVTTETIAFGCVIPRR